MAGEESPYKDVDATLRIVQLAVVQIMAGVDSVTDILNDKQKNTLILNVRNILQQLGIAMTEIFPSEIAEAYGAGSDFAVGQLTAAGEENVSADLKNTVHAAAVQNLAVSGANDLAAAIRTAELLFIANIDKALAAGQDMIALGVLAGDATKTITANFKKRLAEAGLSSFVTSDGKLLPLDFYAMTVTRTKVRQAHVEGSANRYRDAGFDLVRINKRGSATCKICGARQGLVISLDGKTEGFPTAEDIGGLPPFHPNCRHYLEAVTDPENQTPYTFRERDARTANQKAMYDNEQSIRRKANAEKKLYAKMKAEADANGQDFPNIGVWRRMKRKDDERWKQLQSNYRENVRKLRVTR